MENLQIIFLLLIVILTISTAALGWLFLDTRKKIKTILGGKILSSEEDLVRDLVRRVTRLELKQEEFQPKLEHVEQISNISIQKTGFLRFNPFSDTGGDQSFILAMLDLKNNGVIITSLYTREGVRIYGKEIRAGQPKQPLSEEEKKVLENTINKQT